LASHIYMEILAMKRFNLKSHVFSKIEPTS
jgi:hypothetical protein